MKTTVLLTLTICCLLYQTTRAASLNSRDALTRQQILELLELYEEPLRQEGDKRSRGCGGFSGCLPMTVASDRVAALLRNGNAHMFGLNGPGKRRRSVDDMLNSAETE